MGTSEFIFFEFLSGGGLVSVETRTVPRREAHFIIAGKGADGRRRILGPFGRLEVVGGATRQKENEGKDRDPSLRM